MLHRAALVRTDISEEHSASFIRVTRIGKLGITLAVTGNQRTLRRNTKLGIVLVFFHSVVLLLVTVNVVPSSPILVTLMMEAICSFETSVIIRGTWHKMQEDGILHSHRRENLKSYIGIYLC
jgi:hypothetical protein